MNKNSLKKALIAGAIAALAAGCSADGDGSLGGVGGGVFPAPGGGAGTIFPNDGTAGGEVTENGNPITGHFVCTSTAAGVPTTVGADGLVGGTLTPLLNTLGAGLVTTLLNSVIDKDEAADGNLLTASTFILPAGLLFTFIDTIDQTFYNVGGDYAVFGVTFPASVVDLSLLGGIVVTTYQGDTEQESQTFMPTNVDLLGQNVVGDKYAFYGIKATKPFNRATIGIQPPLAVNVGPAMRVHELCPTGNFVP